MRCNKMDDKDQQQGYMWDNQEDGSWEESESLSNTTVTPTGQHDNRHHCQLHDQGQL